MKGNIGKYFRGNGVTVKVIRVIKNEYYKCEVIKGEDYNSRYTSLFTWRFNENDSRYHIRCGYKELKGYNTPLYKTLNGE